MELYAVGVLSMSVLSLSTPVKVYDPSPTWLHWLHNWNMYSICIWEILQQDMENNVDLLKDTVLKRDRLKDTSVSCKFVGRHCLS